MQWRDLYERLASLYPDDAWWPATAPFEVMVGAVLTQNTTWTSVETALDRLRAADALAADALVAWPADELRELIRPAGSFNRKAATLRDLAAWVVREDPEVADGRWPIASGDAPVEGEATTSEQAGGASGQARAQDLPTSLLRRSLLQIHGVGPETADDILLYVYRRPLFIFDAYGRRMLEALGMAIGRDYEATRMLHESAVSESGLTAAELAAFHGFVVSAGKNARRVGWPAALGLP